ncbi:aspartyl/asparaginyl beta-hydroxylase domain-containing protein, partial [Planctomycetota bacterium]|nr:aspartyl/asparaginyl beta-hydroxylase domain-containing protein [Planctomycetota bacterium]
MRLPTEFYRLPLRFDAARLQEEVADLPASAWQPHPQAFAGNTAVPLVSAYGEVNDDMVGPMLATELLYDLPYVRQVMAALNTVIGRSRLMRLAPGAEVQPHTDVHLYWRHHLRVHIPIATDPQVSFHCGERQVHMAAGEAWAFDNWATHKVINPSTVTRVHLVIDTCGSADFWDFMDQAARPFAPGGPKGAPPAERPYMPDAQPELRTELVNLDPIQHPSELTAALDFILDEVSLPNREAEEQRAGVARVLTRLTRDWRSEWGAYGASPAGWDRFRALATAYAARAQRAAGSLVLTANGSALGNVLTKWIHSAINTKLIHDAQALMDDSVTQVSDVQGSLTIRRPAPASQPAAPSSAAPRRRIMLDP